MVKKCSLLSIICSRLETVHSEFEVWALARQKPRARSVIYLHQFLSPLFPPWLILKSKNRALLKHNFGKKINGRSWRKTQKYSQKNSSLLWWRRESSMAVESKTTGRASRNRIGACTRGPASWADLTVRVDRVRNLFVPPLVGAAIRLA